MAQFHLFIDLPRELQDSIWDMAIRDNDPAVHFFTMYDKDDPDSVIDPTKKIHVTRDPYTPNFWAGLAAPRGHRKGRPSWTDGNISTYLTDSGLWTACHGSRERMLRHFRPSETSPQASRHVPLDWRTITGIRDRPTASVNMEFSRDNGERQYLTIRPSTDLVCLQLLENSDLSFGRYCFDWQSFGGFPLFMWPSAECTSYGCYADIKNVAVEYDPAWEGSDPDDRYSSVCAAFTCVYEIPGLETFWFIDYRLTRKYKRDEEIEGDRRMFHAGRLTFIEVSIIDSEWCCCPKEPQGCSDECIGKRLGCAPHGPHELADKFESHHEQRFDLPYFHDEDRTWFWGDYGVLACVDLELEGELPTMKEFYEINEERIDALW